MGIFDYFLEKVASMQKKIPYIILALALLFTLFMFYGFMNVEFQGDFQKEMPSELPIYRLNDKVSSNFGGQDVIFIMLELDKDLKYKGLYDDIRHPDIMKYLFDLERSLMDESSIDSVISIGSFYPQILSVEQNPDLNFIIEFSDNIPPFSRLVNSEYSIAVMIITAEVGSGEERIIALTEMIQGKIDAMSKPSGVDVIITGTPSILIEVLKLLRHDSVYTLLLAAAIIFLLLIVMLKSLKKTILISIPLLFAIIWTVGALGWLNIKISVATAGLGAMVLGLGVEYGVFILSRYYEEREKGKNQEKSLKASVQGVGSAIFGSGLTTIVGFIALTLSIMPMLQNLGLSLAIGIFFCIIAAVIFEPALIIIEENLEYSLTEKKSKSIKEKLKLQRRLPR
jgi:uncharacterized protein